MTEFNDYIYFCFLQCINKINAFDSLSNLDISGSFAYRNMKYHIIGFTKKPFK